jgi:predicted lipoprotein with Yx(FWY)xxD motif
MSTVWASPRLIPAVACAAALAACGEDPAEAPKPRRAEASPTGAAPAARQAGPLVTLRDSQFGPVIFNGRAQAAYTFTRDAEGRSRCYGDCAKAWPPFFADARPRAARGVKRPLLGTVRRRGGRSQVTYAGRPLYFYAHDPKGEVLCNDIAEFGGTWFAVTASGKPPS